MRNWCNTGVLLLFLFAGIACRREKDITINLPPYDRMMAVECYLEIGKPVQLVLTESVSYFDTPALTPIYNAIVIIKYKNITDTLKNIVYTDKVQDKGYNYISGFVVPEDYDNDFYITIKAQDGRNAYAQTKLQHVAPILKTEAVKQNDYSKIKVTFNDNTATRDFYRILIFERALHTTPATDVLITDALYGTPQIIIQPQVNFPVNDSVIIELYHINEDYYNYLQSVENALVANIDPLTRPTKIKSNVTGAVGIFTSLAVSRDTIVVK